jgi:hypothetical protein
MELILLAAILIAAKAKTAIINIKYFNLIIGY